MEHQFLCSLKLTVLYSRSCTAWLWSSESWIRSGWSSVMVFFLCGWTSTLSSISESVSQPALFKMSFMLFLNMNWSFTLIILCFLCVFLASLTPSVPFGRLEQFTELIVSPKLHPGNELLHKPQFEEPRQHLQHQNVNITSSSTSNVPQDPFNDHPESFNEGHWGGITDLKGLVRYLFTRREPAKENIAVPTIPAILKDCILRTCGSPPRSVSHLGSCHGDVHILPWNLQEQENWNPGQSALTYGRLSKILSPKELREKVKQAMEKKKIRDASHKEKDTEEHMENSAVVRMLCHNINRLQGDQKFNKCEEIYSAKVWVSFSIAI